MSYPNHPFPYFGLEVTRDSEKIQNKLNAKYETAKQFEHNPMLVRKWHEFNEYVILIADHAGLGKTFTVNPAKVNAIVDTCLKQVDPMLRVAVRDGTINPSQVAAAKASAKESFKIDLADAVPYIDRWLVDNQITITRDLAPTKPREESKPVLNLVAESRPEQVQLCWQLPPDGCDYVLIQRNDSSIGSEVRDSLTWTDRQPIPGQQHEYLVYSVMEGESPGAVVPVCAVGRGVVKDLSVSVERKSVRLKWKLPSNTISVTLLRSFASIHDVIDNSGRVALPNNATTIELDSIEEYEDHDVSAAKTYHYLVVARHTGGMCSISECRAASFAKAPPAPRDVQVNIVAGEIHLSWNDVSEVIDPDYVVAVSDTGVLETDQGTDSSVKRHHVDQAMFEHSATHPGKRYWYFLWTKQGDLISSQPVCVGPIVATAEVTNLTASASTGQVELRWTTPPGAKRVEVRRGAGGVPVPPNKSDASARERGVMVQVLDDGRLVDSRLSDGMTYGYRVSTVYSQADGKEIISQGAVVTATPCAPPELVNNIHAKLDSGTMLVSWDNPTDALVRVLRANKLPKVPDGWSGNLEELSELGQRLTHVSVTQARDASPDASVPYYLVFTCNQFLTTYCGYAVYADVSALESKSEHDNIILSWHWPANCSAVKVQHSSPDQSLATHSVPHGRDERGVLILPVNSVGQHSIRVTCCVADKANVVAGPGATTTVSLGLATRVKWEFGRTWTERMSGRASKVIIESNGDLSSVRSIRLTGKLNALPDTPTDGRLLASWDAASSKIDGSIALPIQSWQGRKGTVFCRLFVIPEGVVRIVSPPVENITLKV